MGMGSAKMIGRVCCALLLIAAIVHCEDAAALDEIDKVALPVNDPHYLDYTVQLIDEFDQGVQAKASKLAAKAMAAAKKKEDKAVKQKKAAKKEQKAAKKAVKKEKVAKKAAKAAKKEAK